MKSFRRLGLFLLMLVLPGAGKGAEETFYDNGKVKESFERLMKPDGKMGGVIKYFYPDGTLKLEMPIVEAGGEMGYAPDGVVKAYHPNGKIESSVEWRSGKRNGPFESFHRDGTLREKGEFTGDKSKTAERFSQAHRKLGHEPCVVVEIDRPRVTLPEKVVLHAYNYHDTGAHLGWVFGYRLVGKEWKKVFQQPGGNHIESRKSKAILVDAKDLAPGEWQFVVTSFVGGPEFLAEARSATIRIEQAAAGDGGKPAK